MIQIASISRQTKKHVLWNENIHLVQEKPYHYPIPDSSVQNFPAILFG